MDDYEIIATLEFVTIQEAKLSYAERENLPKEAFCGPNRSYPSHDTAHVRAGLQRISQFGKKMKPAVKARIEGCLKARAKKFGIEVTETALVEKEALEKWYIESGLD
jgi:hypothetical protein